MDFIRRAAQAWDAAQKNMPGQLPQNLPSLPPVQPTGQPGISMRPAHKR